MSAAIAIQPAIHRPSPIPIAAARPRTKRSLSGKENLPQVKNVTGSTTATTNGNNARARRERPCDACRRRKSRCVIQEGALLCVLCDFHKQECTFVQEPQPRKRKIPTSDGKEDSAKKRTGEVYSPALVSQKVNITPTITRTSPPIAPSPIQLPSNIRDSTALGETLGLQRRSHSRYIGLTTPFDPLLIGLSNFDTRNESAIDLGILRRVNDHECFIMLPDENTHQIGNDGEVLAQIEQIVAPHGSALIDLYFRTVHPSFPIIQKQLLLQRYHGGDRSMSPALMAGIYILALNWWSHDSVLAKQTKPASAQLEAIASKSLAVAMERPKLSAVQAGLLLLQRPGADSWSLTTQLVAIGQELGLHLDCSNWSIPGWERGLRKRIAWALYMQDKWSSLIHGRPSHIFSANWAVKNIIDEDFQEQPAGADATDVEKEEAEKGRAIYGEMISLTGIMAEVMDTFYTQVAIQDFANAGKNSTRLILDRAKPVQIRLKEWFAKLPAVTRMDHPTSSSSSLSSTGYLHLAYFATEITLHRRLIQSLDTTSSDSYLLYICRQAAKTRLISAMDFVNRLKPGHLQAFWYFASKINFTLVGTFGSLLWATAPGKEEADFYKFRLKEYRWTLIVSAKRAEFLDYAVQMLDASRTMLKNIAEKPSMMQRQISSAGVPPPANSSTLSSASTSQTALATGPHGSSSASGTASGSDIQMRHLGHSGQSSNAHSSAASTIGAGGDTLMPDVEMGSLLQSGRYHSTSSFAGFQNEEMYAADERAAAQGMRGLEGGSEDEDEN